MDGSLVSKHRVIAHPLPTTKIQSGNRIVAVKEEHAGISVGHNIIDQYSPLGSNTILQNATARTEFQIFSTRLNSVCGIFIELYVTNNDGVNSLELISPYFWPTLIEVLVNNNSEQEVYAEGNLWAHRAMTDEQTLILTRFINLLNPNTLTGRDAAGLNPILIAPGETRVVYIPINNSLFEQTKVPFGSIKSTLRFRYTWDIFGNVTSTQNLMIVPANLQVSSQQLYIFGTALSRAGTDEIQTALLSSPYSANYMKQERQVINNGATLPGQRPKQSLTNFNGTYTNLVFLMRSLNPVKELQYQWNFTPVVGYNPTRYYISQVTLNDSNGSPYSLNQQSFLISKYFDALLTGCKGEGAKYSTFNDKFSFVVFTLSDDEWMEIRTGVPGGITINNAWSIEYTVGNAGQPVISPYVNTPFPVLGEQTETCILGDRLYSILLDTNGQLKCSAQ